MVTLKIDEETFAAWQKKAGQRGLTVEDWLKDKTIGAEPFEPTSKKQQAVEESWQERLQALIALHPSTGKPIDDSRESIYD